MRVLKKLSINNFLGTKKREVDFDLMDELVFIVGENAGGKTTIMRAIYFALTGEDAFFGKTKLDGLINDHSNEMKIELSLVNKGNDYDITISKTKNKALDIEVKENGKSLLESKLNKEAKDLLSKLFGNPTSILSTYFIFGDNKNDFVENTPTGRLNVITKVSDAFQRYEDISNNAKGFIKKLELEKQSKNGKIELARNNVEELRELVLNFDKKTEENKLDTSKKELDILLNDKQLKKSINEIDQKLEKLSKADIKDIQTKLSNDKQNKKDNDKVLEQVSKEEELKSELSNKLNDINLEKTKIESEKTNFINNINTNKSYLVEIDQNLLQENKDNSIETISERIQKGKTIVDEKLKKGTELKSSISYKKEEINKLTNEIENQNKLLKEADDLFNHNTTCPLCHNELTQKSLENYKKFINTEKDNLTKQIKDLEKNINELEEEKVKVGNEYIKYTNVLKQLELLIKEKEKEENNNKINQKIEKENVLLKEKEIEVVKKQEEYEKQNNLVKEQIEKINKLKSSLKELLSDNEIEKYNEILKLNEESNILEGQKRDLLNKVSEKNKEEGLNIIVSKISELEYSIDSIKTNINKNESYKERLVNEEKKEEVIRLEIKELNSNLEQYEDLAKLFGKDGIQKRQIQMLLGQIEIETNALIKKFFDNISVKFGYDNKGIDLKILRRVIFNDGSFENKEDVIGNFSDAQQEVLKVLLKLSFSKVVQNLNNTPLNMLFLNETFNTLSKDKEPVLVDVLNHYNKDYHIAFITHNDDLIGNYGTNNLYNISE